MIPTSLVFTVLIAMIIGQIVGEALYGWTDREMLSSIIFGQISFVAVLLVMSHFHSLLNR